MESGSVARVSSTLVMSSHVDTGPDNRVACCKAVASPRSGQPLFGAAPAENASRPARSIGRSAFDLVVNSGHHRLVQLDASRVQDRNEGGPKRVECFLRFPDVEDLDLAVCLKGDVVDPSIRGSRARLFGAGRALCRNSPA